MNGINRSSNTYISQDDLKAKLDAVKKHSHYSFWSLFKLFPLSIVGSFAASLGIALIAWFLFALADDYATFNDVYYDAGFGVYSWIILSVYFSVDSVLTIKHNRKTVIELEKKIAENERKSGKPY